MSKPLLKQITALWQQIIDSLDWTLTQSQVLALEAEEDSHVLDGIEEELARFNRLSLYKPAVPPADINPVYETYMADR